MREKLAVAECDWNTVSAELTASGEVVEAAVLSTCNRFEVYYAASEPREALASVTQFLSKRANIPVSSQIGRAHV